ncbi:hypothetical protein [Halorussus halobius]|uniref:hypothetical protein n=1 Tax=Halorussus halobius TaxID=1710537 RepID=UPI0010921354|nr:hypothetical protein [Halorussus halobius]
MAVQPTPSDRPWYCPDGLVDAYKHVAHSGGNLRMLQHLKVVRAIVTNLLVAGVAYHAITSGGDPSLIGSTAVAALALLNGIEVGEWIAAKQALDELDQNVEE